MSRLLVLMGGAALLATGFGVGFVASSTGSDPAGAPTEVEKVVIRLKDGLIELDQSGGGRNRKAKEVEAAAHPVAGTPERAP